MCKRRLGVASQPEASQTLWRQSLHGDICAQADGIDLRRCKPPPNCAGDGGEDNLAAGATHLANKVSNKQPLADMEECSLLHGGVRH